MKVRAALIVALCFFIPVAPGQVTPSSTLLAQDPLTILGILAAARGVLEELNKLGGTLTGGALNAVNSASAALSQRIQELEKLAQGQVARPLQQLSRDVQEAALQLNSAVARLQPILAEQQRCLFQNTEHLMSGAQNVASELRGVVPLRDRGEPRLNSYRFEGIASGVVPVKGGRFTIEGYRLWETPAAAPEIDVMDAGRTVVLRNLVPQRGASSNSISANLDAPVITDFRGQCLQLRVRSTVPGGFLRRSRTAENYLPLCVAEAYATEFSVKAWTAYSCMRKDRRALEAKQFLYYNNNMSDRLPIDDTRTWEMPAGCKIVSFTDARHNEREESAITVRITGAQTINASGWLSDAVDFNPPIGPRRLLHSAIWDHFVTPTIECDVPHEKTDSSPGVRVALSAPTTTINVNVPKECDSSETHFWFEVVPFVNGQAGTWHYESPRITAAGSAARTPLASLENYTIEGVLNPARINGATQLSVAINAPAACR